MNLAAVMAKHKAGAVAGGGAAVVGVALYARSRKSTAAAGSKIIQPGTVNSTGSDVYNSIEPLIENQDAQLASFSTQLQNALNKLNPASQPVPTPPALPPTAPPVTAPSPPPAPIVTPPTPAPAPVVAPPSAVPAITNALAGAPPAGSSGQVTVVPTGNGTAFAYGWSPASLAAPSFPFAYGGTAAQAAAIPEAQAAPPATPPPDYTPPSWGGQGGWNDPRYSW